MSSDMETFTCMIFNTKYMNNLIFGSGKSVETYEKEINIIENWENYKDILDVAKLNNEHINNAIRELIENQSLVNELLKSTNITKEEIEKLKEYLKN